VFHYDVAQKRDVAGRTVITDAWRYTAWENGASGRELYLRSDGTGEFRNRSGDAAQKQTVESGETFLRAIPEPKPGRAERPRALLPQAKK
jgi:hypothetical protein